MNSEQAAQDGDAESKAALELYKIAFARLSYQDEHLFKFSTLFLTVHGALALLARSAVGESGTISGAILGFASAVGLVLAIVWVVWVHHNDHWHAVWIGTLRRIEPRLGTSARIFKANHRAIARAGRRGGACLPKGHCLAMAIPIIIGAAWLVALIIAIYASR